MQRQHWIIKVADAINDYQEVQGGYFDGTASAAKIYFATNKPWRKYFGNERYQITMRANPIVLQDPVDKTSDLFV